ncbi:MAG: hypothetical protein K2O54_03670, partial [Prevotella sp.]|nr:hypothetical protein [Prevotella sp.]
MLSNGEFLKEVNEIALKSELIRDNKKIEYYNIPAGFDIEVSSFYQGDRVPENKRAIMYIWQLGIFNKVTYGRTWESLSLLINAIKTVMGLNANRRLLVYVHNLPYEFQFIRKRFKWDKVFLLKERKPVYALDNG